MSFIQSIMSKHSKEKYFKEHRDLLLLKSHLYHLVNKINGQETFFCLVTEIKIC